jgi:uncharacterized membrane protein YbaN (DUF454 family)
MKYIFVFLGFFFMILGIIGLLLPIMPTVPFLFVAYACFRKGSKRFNDWYINTKIHKYYIKSIEKVKKIPFRQKIIYAASITIFFACLFTFWIKIAPYAIHFFTRLI